MRSVVLFVVLLLSATTVRAEDAKPEGKAGEKAANLDVELHGVLRPKPKDAPENVAALFIVISNKFGIVDERKAVNLFATGDTAKTLAELAKDKSTADITGTIVEGGINVKQAAAYITKKQAKKAQEKTVEAPPAKNETGKSTTPPKKKASDEEF